MNTKYCVKLAVAGACLMLPAATLEAGTIIYSDLGVVTPYNGGSAWDVEGTSTATFQSIGAPFTPGANYSLTEIDVALQYLSGTNAVTLALETDSSGVPGTVLEAWALTSLPDFSSTSSVLQMETPTSPILLLAGTQYWVVAIPGAADTTAGWNFANTGVTPNLDVLDTVGGTWFTDTSNSNPAFDVQGNLTSAPEPSTALFAAGGLLLLGFARRRS
jgi:hypothetical protein